MSPRVRDKAQAKKRPAPISRYSQVRAVACEQVHLRYASVDLPGSCRQLDAIVFPKGAEGEEEKIHPFDRMLQLTTRKSWEIMTERLTG